MDSSKSSVLVIQTAFLGDIVLTTPLIAKLQDEFSVTVLTTQIGKDVLENFPKLNVIVFDKKNKDKGFWGFLRKAGELRNHKFEKAFVPHPSIKSAFLAKFSGAREIIGFDDSEGAWLFTQKINKLKKFRFITNVLRLFSENIIPSQSENETLKPGLYFSESDVTKAELLLKSNSIHENDKFIAIAPSSQWETKKWQKEKFIDLILEIQNRYKIKCVLIGSKQELGLCEKIANASSAVNLAAKTTIGELKVILNKSQLLVTNDSGPMHIASAFNKKIVAIFGPTTKELGFFPPNDIASVIEVDLPCRPCGKHGHNKCPIGTHDCMKKISVDMVMEEIKKCLSLIKVD